MCEVIVRQATIGDVDVLVPLFDAYRQFYRQQRDSESARRFLLERLRFNQSVVYLAGLTKDAAPSGFVQLFPSFSSTRLAQIWILNDLFVAPERRRRGVATHLLNTAVQFARHCGAARLTLSTEVTNVEAQTLYERQGWTRSVNFHAYNFTII